MQGDQLSEKQWRNADVKLPERQLLENLQKVQLHRNLPISEALVKANVSP